MNNPDKVRGPEHRNDGAENLVLLLRTGSVRTLMLNRSEKRNAAGFAMQRRILEVMNEVAADSEAKVLVLAGAGPSFCAGGDRADLAAAGEGKLDNQAEFAAMQQEMMRTMLSMEIPAIAAVNGAASGFGAALVALCDIAILAEDAALWDPHVLFGVQPSLMLQLIWPRLTSLAVARDLLMTGRKIAAAEAVQLGLASRICPVGMARTEAMALAETFAAMPITGVSGAKQRFNRPVLAELDAIEAGLEG